MEEYTSENQEASVAKAKRWFQDNLRIIISVAIVVVIAGGIYSYSNRTQAPTVTEEAIENEIAIEAPAEQKLNDAKETSSAPVSKETESSFIETAGKGDGTTVLARRALANYLEKNADSTLTKEHKIFIEDYLRKNSGFKGGVKVGTSVEFSKDSIQKAIEQSKKLNDKQLKNLQKYSAKVKSL